ncbi:MAG: Lrp/AsnC ligand binding domain-containing protein [Candidatus Bathyarchaeia archaeon]
MTKACVLIKTIPTRIEKTLEGVKKFKETLKAYMVFGRWDVVAFLDVEDYHDLKNITSKINMMDGVRSTETLVEA